MKIKKIIAGMLMAVFCLSFVSCNKTIKRNPLEKLDNKIVEQIKTPAELEAEKKLAGTDNNNTTGTDNNNTTGTDNNNTTGTDNNNTTGTDNNNTTGTDNNNTTGYIFQSLFDFSKVVLLFSASVIIGVFAVRLCAGAIAYYYM